MNQNRNNRYAPVLMAISMVIGIVIGTFYANHFSPHLSNPSSLHYQKF